VWRATVAIAVTLMLVVLSAPPASAIAPPAIDPVS
jgi:hypothetical protein